MKHIAIVGGGLAGLAAAYTLSKDETMHVSVFESGATLGGRTQSRMVRDHQVDFGGFLIYPWYKEAHKIIDALGLKDELLKTPLKDIYYFLDESGPVKEDHIKFPKMDMMKIWSKSIFKLLPETHVSNPNLDIFEHKTISEYLRTALGVSLHAGIYESFFDTVNQGYCYGPAMNVKIAFMAPFIRQTALFGDIHRTSFFPNGTQIISERMAEEIKRNGGTIFLNTPVTGVSGQTITTGSTSTTFDEIVFAQTVSSDLYRQILPEVTPEIWYTHFVTVAVELSDIPLVDDAQLWGAAFYLPEEQKPYQALSVINLASLYGPTLASCVTMNIILKDTHLDPENATDLEQIVRNEIQRLFPNEHVVSVLNSVHWKKTMPVVEESFVSAVRSQQGKNHFYFAGDYLGAPSMETAISTGVHAANLLLKQNNGIA